MNKNCNNFVSPKLFSILVCFLLLSFSVEAFAKWEYRVTPLFRLNHLYYMDEIPGTEQNRTSFRAELNGVYRWKRSFKFVFQPIFEFDPTAKDSITSISGSIDNSEKLYYDLREAYFQFRLKPFTVQLGNQVFSWGVNDGFSPIDVINARRYVSPLSADKIGAPAATVKWNAGDFDLEFVYIPIQRESILPGEDSRWLPREFYITPNEPGIIVELPANFRYFYKDSEEFDEALSNNFALRFRGQLSSLDFSLMYFQGFAASPSVNFQLSGNVTNAGSATTPVVITLNSDFGLVPVYYKRRVVGGTLVYTLGEFIFRLESAFNSQISDNIQNGLPKGLPGDFSEHVLSVEHDFPIGNSSITAVLQATYSNYETDSENGTTSIGRIFDGAVIAGLRYAPNELTSFVGSYIYDTKRKDTVFALNAEHKFFDSLTTSLTMSLIDGNDLSPLGAYEKNDLLSLSLRYDF